MHLNRSQAMHLSEFARGDADIQNFETWVYADEELDVALGEALYLKLISCNFRNDEAVHQCRRVVWSALVASKKCECFLIKNRDGVKLFESGYDDGLGHWSYDDFVATQTRVFGPVDEIDWLFISQCSICETNWLVHEDARSFESYYLERINEQTVQKSIQGIWPPTDTFALKRYKRTISEA